MAEHLLRVEGLDVAYADALTSLHGVNLAVAEGAIVAVLGSNGAGKTTLLRAISGTLSAHRGRITSGEIHFDGGRISGLDTAEIVRRGVIQVPEGRRVFAGLTVEENLRAGGYAVGRAQRQKARARVYELFPILADRRNQRAGLLSGGQQQMLAMGRALMGSPRLLLLDEPSLGLAPQLVEQVGEIITTINAQGTAVLLIEQNASMGLAVASQAVVLEVGRVTAAAPVEELARTEEIRDRYLGVGSTAQGGPPSRAGNDSEAPDVDRQQMDLPRKSPGPLQIDDVTVNFGGIIAMNGVTFEVRPGTVHALIGPNGAGKSTCINVLSGVHRATSGTIRYRDRDLGTVPPHDIAGLGVSRTFQNLALSPTMTVADSLLVGRHRLLRSGALATGLRLPSAQREERAHRRIVEGIADLLALTPLLQAPIETLPYGVRKRVELARAIASEPEVLLLDEPVAGMNHEESQRMASAIRLIRSALGISVLVVDHDMTFVMGIADHVTVLDFGRCIADGTPEVIRNDPAVIEAYLGSSA